MESEGFLLKIEKIKMPIRVLILVGTLALFLGLFTYFVYFPKKTDIKKTTDSISKLTLKLNRVKLRAKNRDKLEAELKRVNAQFREQLKLLPNKKEIPDLLRTITKLGRDSNLEFRLFSPRSERRKGFYLEIPVSIIVSGSYHNVALFFDKVGRMDRIVNILNVSMKPVKALSTRLVTTCSAITFRFVPQKAKAKPKKGTKKKK